MGMPLSPFRISLPYPSNAPRFSDQLVDMSKPKKEIKTNLISYITLGLLDSLSAHVNVCNIDCSLGESVDKTDIVAWEQMYMCVLPLDMKNFYLCCNGLTLRWSYRSDGEVIPLGHLNINSLSHLRKVGGFIPTTSETPTVLDIDSDTEINFDHGLTPPTFGTNFKLFEIDRGLDGAGQICLVYECPSDGAQEFSNPSIWYLDRSFSWHLLAKNFTAYFRLSLAHLGLPRWQDLLTPFGIPEHAKKWYHLFAPLTSNLESGLIASTGFVVDGFQDEDRITKVDFAQMRKECS